MVVICAACKAFLGTVEDRKDAKLLATAHGPACTASTEEYEQALYDLKFRQITEGLDL